MKPKRKDLAENSSASCGKMSRIGRLPITLPPGVAVRVDGQTVEVAGPKGTLSRTMHPLISASVEAHVVVVKRTGDTKLATSLHGLTRSLLANMVRGVSEGFEKRLELVGTGYRVAKAGKGLTMTLGFSHPVTVSPIEGIEFDVEGNNAIIIRGIDNELVGQTAANIRHFRPPEPYKGKGVRYAGEHVRRKAGKQAKTAAA